MSAAETPLHLSPSQCHRHLLAHTVPRLRYEGGEVAVWQRRLRARLHRLRQLQRIYRADGAAGRCHHVVGQGGHRFYAEDAWPVMLEELARLGGKKGRGRN